jgi:hypothetical protein
MSGDGAAAEPERALPPLPEPREDADAAVGGASLDRPLPDTPHVCDPELLASLREIYREHVPEKSEQEVEALIDKYQGREGKLLEKVRKKYLGVAAAPAVAAAAAGPQPQRIEVTSLAESGKSYGPTATYKILWHDETGTVHEASRRYKEFHGLRASLLKSSMISSAVAALPFPGKKWVHTGRHANLLEQRATLLNEFLTELVVTQKLVTPKDGAGASPDMALCFDFLHQTIASADSIVNKITRY